MKPEKPLTSASAAFATLATVLATLATLATASPAVAGPAFGLGLESLTEAARPAEFRPLTGNDADLTAYGRLAPDEPAPAAAEAPAPPKKLRVGRTTALFSAGVVAGGYLVWWRGRDFKKFSVNRENWFGENTYAGGNDKASHFVFGYVLTRAFRLGYESAGVERKKALLYAGLAGVAGSWLVEVGDGFVNYGFGVEDGIITSAGALVAVGLDALNLNDTVGLRYGPLVAEIPEDPAFNEFAKDANHYDTEIYTIDVAMRGLLPRLGVKKPGLARYALLSLTYNSKGYGTIRPGQRDRQLGIEVGLNVPEVLRALGARDDKPWWGPILWVLERVRLPFTGIGFRYELNRNRWHGPDFGDRFYGDVTAP
ncbi:MAG: DUF2279 domain-containing protein [Acidobacteria bacterium]|nr:DUF2279 domain-containing protein [Acidobacteriota bacterium]